MDYMITILGSIAVILTVYLRIAVAIDCANRKQKSNR